jgi:hypothetical protein
MASGVVDQIRMTDTNAAGSDMIFSSAQIIKLRSP